MALLLAEFRAQLLQFLIFEEVDVRPESGFLRAQHLLEVLQVSLLAILTLRQYPRIDER